MTIATPFFYNANDNIDKVICVTGGAQRIGRRMVEAFHSLGYRVIIHYHKSHQAADALKDQCNQQRPHSAITVQANLEQIEGIEQLADYIKTSFGRLDVLVHNASRFYPTPFGTIQQHDWHNLMASNAHAPLFLTQSLIPLLKASQGCVISLLDIHADNHPFMGYSIYNMAKAAQRMLVQSLALELAPLIRVNGIAPGVNILPESGTEQAIPQPQLEQICANIPLQRIGIPDDIAQAAIFLAHASYITGQILAVDGGRSLTLAGY